MEPGFSNSGTFIVVSLVICKNNYIEKEVFMWERQKKFNL